MRYNHTVLSCGDLLRVIEFKQDRYITSDSHRLTYYNLTKEEEAQWCGTMWGFGKYFLNISSCIDLAKYRVKNV